MSEGKLFLTPDELSDRYEGRINVRTLTNWRSQGKGPRFQKIGGAILYRMRDIEAWETENSYSSTSEYGR